MTQLSVHWGALKRAIGSNSFWRQNPRLDLKSYSSSSQAQRISLQNKEARRDQRQVKVADTPKQSCSGSHTRNTMIIFSTYPLKQLLKKT